MIGFAIEVQVWCGDSGDVANRTALLRLDTDGDEPTADIRFAGDNDAIVNIDPDDLFAAVYEIRSQATDWKRARLAEQQSAKGAA